MFPAFVGASGCPLPPGGPGPSAPPPSPPPPPPAPAPAPDTTTTVEMTDDGLVFNGNVYYLGFTPTAQTASGTVTVRGGPDATYAVIHQVASPVTGTTYYASGVDPEDSLTWIECASLYTTHSGTSQTVDYILGDRE